MNKTKVFAVAPMMDWTDRYCRYFHRLITQKALLYTEMITANAIHYGDREKLLQCDAQEHPVVLQLGGSEPLLLAEACRIGQDYGYCAINLNVGCPSDRVREGRFGACLMAEPDLVARCITAMKNATSLPVTIKCRIGIDDQDDYTHLNKFVATTAKAGCQEFIIHARKAWLQGLSPKENREIPPLNYGRVYQLKEEFPNLTISLNGGLETVEQAKAACANLDGVMLGRAAYHNPWELAQVDERFYGVPRQQQESRFNVVEKIYPFIEQELSKGVWLSKITRHMLGLFHAEAGGRLWRQVLSEGSHKPGAGVALVAQALEMVKQHSKV